MKYTIKGIELINKNNESESIYWNVEDEKEQEIIESWVEKYSEEYNVININYINVKLKKEDKKEVLEILIDEILRFTEPTIKKIYIQILNNMRIKKRIVRDNFRETVRPKYKDNISEIQYSWVYD